MTARCFESYTNELESLMNHLSKRRWCRSFNSHDVKAMLGVDFDCQKVISQGITTGYFEQDIGGYQLTRKGSTRLNTLRAARTSGGETSKYPSGSRRIINFPPPLRPIRTPGGLLI